MENDNHSMQDRVIAAIKRGGTAMRPRAYFVRRNLLMWGLAGASIVMGALAVSSILFRAANARAALGPGAPPPLDAFIVVPFLWIILTALFGYLAYREVRLTDRGYKYELSTILLAMIVASGVFGAAFYVSGAGFALDRVAGRYLPFHPDLERVQRDHWQSPEEGLLVGAILSEEAELEENERFYLIDPEEARWALAFTDAIEDEELEELEEGERVGLRGSVTGDHAFLVCEIRSLEFSGRGAFMPPPAHPLPPPRERKLPSARTNPCEDVRPPTH